MCNKPVATALRGAVDTVTFGTAELGGTSSKIGQMGANMISPPKPETPPAPGSVNPYGPDGPPQQTGGVANSDAAKASQAAAQKRARALQAGVMGTIGTGYGLGGPGSSQSNSPNAFAAGMKQFTGQ